MDKKRTQNIIAESRRTLPVAITYGTGIWLLAGALQHGWWLQFICFFASVYTIIHLNNINLLIRIYSRSVSVFFILLGCAATWLFPSIQTGVTSLFSALSLLLLFSCYQDKTSTGRTFYMFLLLSSMSLYDPYLLLFIPVYLILMAITIYSLTFRTFFAALIGLITPYWLFTGWQLYLYRQQPEKSIEYLAQLTHMQWIADYTAVSTAQWCYLGLLTVLFVVGAIHFWLTSYMDKIRVRQIYSSLIILTIYAIVWVAILPQKCDTFICMLTITVSPIAAHFFTLTRTRLSNIFYLVTMTAIVALTAMNLWIL